MKFWITIFALVISSVAYAQGFWTIARWNGLLRDYRLVGDRGLHLRFVESDVSGGNVLLRWDPQDFCDTDVGFDDFVTALGAYNKPMVATIPLCDIEGRGTMVCVSSYFETGVNTCASFVIEGWNLKWIDD